MIIREMYIDDYVEMYDLWTRTAGIGINEADSRECIIRFLDRNEGLSFVCEEDGVIIGTILCGHDGRRGYIYHTAVDSRYRGKGIGKKLVDKGLEALHKEGMTKCHIFVKSGNSLGIVFWNRTGWMKRNDIFVFSKDLKWRD